MVVVWQRFCNLSSRIWFIHSSSDPEPELLCSSSSESNSSHDLWYVLFDIVCHRAMLCAVANATSLQRDNIIVVLPFVPANELMTASLRFSWIVCSSVRMSSDATDTGNGSMYSRTGSISARHVGHVFFVFKDDSKHDMQNLCPHAVTATFLGPGTSMHTGHRSTSGSGAAAAAGWLRRYCIVGWLGSGSVVQHWVQFLHELG